MLPLNSVADNQESYQAITEPRIQTFIVFPYINSTPYVAQLFDHLVHEAFGG
jgi:hypothetical protein